MPIAADFSDNVCLNLTATIADGGTTSEEIDLGGTQLVGIFVPSGFDGTTITLTAAPTKGGTHVAVQDGDGSSSSFTITTAASRYVPIAKLSIVAGLRYVKFVAGTQTGAAVLTLVTRPL